MPKTNADKIAPYADMVGDVPDAKIAEMAGVTEAAVAKYRAERSKEAEAEPEPKPDAPAPAAPEPSDEPAEADARTTALAGAAEGLLAKGWRLQDGELVPPTVQPKGPELVIRLKRGVRLQGKGVNGKLVTIPLARSLYRGAMARRVIELVGEDSDLIEHVSG